MRYLTTLHLRIRAYLQRGHIAQRTDAATLINEIGRTER